MAAGRAQCVENKRVTCFD